MTVIPFDINDTYFAVDIEHIVEIIPLVTIEKIIDANPQLSGLINYRGVLIPIVDLKKFFYNENSNFLLSTRIIIYNYKEQVIGLIVENLTDTLELDQNELIKDTQILSGSNYIKSYFIEDDKTIKMIDVMKIFDKIYNL